MYMSRSFSLVYLELLSFTKGNDISFACEDTKITVIIRPLFQLLLIQRVKLGGEIKKK